MRCIGRAIGLAIRAVALWSAILPSVAAGDPWWVTSEAVIPGGQEPLISEMLASGVVLPGDCKLAGAVVDGPSIRATYDCAGGEVVIALLDPRAAARRAATRTGQFTIAVESGTPPTGLIAALESRIRSREGDFRWTNIARPVFDASPRAAVAAASALLPATGALAETVRLVRALRRRRSSRSRRAAVGVAALRIAGLVAVAAIPFAGAMPQDEGFAGLATCFGVAGLATFLWLACTGFFGCAGVRSSDWVGLVPFVVALIVREGLTLHSVQEIEIQFAQGHLDKHSVVYPLLQMFFMPIVRDPHVFTMHMNGVLGAIACLALYLFVSQRLASRSAGVLCALFLATHPLVARFAPTDGVYSLLLASWFCGLALLSAPALHARALAGGAVLVAIAATLRVEGVVFLLASLLLVDLRAIANVARRNRLVALGSLLVVAGLAALQMAFVLRLNVGNFPAMPTVDSLLWPIVSNGRLFTALVAIGALSGILTRSRLGLLVCVGMLIVQAPVAHSNFPIALHRLVPACALQAMLAGLGAHALTAAWPRARGWRWLATVPGALAAFYVLAQHRRDLTTPYVFTDEYQIVRHHLAPGGAPLGDCALLSFNRHGLGDVGLHDLAQVVPDVRVIDCYETDCVTELSRGGCFYYARTAAAYFHTDGDSSPCDVAGTSGDQGSGGCLNRTIASFESSVGLETVEVRTIDVLSTFPGASRNYPPRAEIGLFRVRPKSTDPRRDHTGVSDRPS